jgi:glycosyltransferase involved in cell wall biosynthesis
MTLLYFVTPAFERVELTAVCLEQRRHVINRLAELGIDAQCVVIADDENLDTAHALGFDTIHQDNQWLGRKFNDGIEHAAAAGAEWICLIGSDDWIDADYLAPLPRPDHGLTSHYYAPVKSDRLATCRVGRQLAGPRVFHRSQLEGCGFRPQRDEINRNTDHSTLTGVGPIDWEIRDVHPLQFVGFRAEPYITSYDRLVRWWGVAEYPDPWTMLARYYPVELVERAQAAMA